MNEPLDQLARWYGIQSHYHDIDGTRRVASEDIACHVLRALGAPLERAADAADALAMLRAQTGAGFASPVVVAWNGVIPPVPLHDSDSADSPLSLRLYLGDGRTVSWLGSWSPGVRDGRPVRLLEIPVSAVPFGMHRLEVDLPAGPAVCTVLAAPVKVPQPAARTWGVLFPLHAYGARTEGGVTGYDGLQRLCAWVHSLGGSFVSTLPLLAAFLNEPFEPSPYVPASRLFWNDLFIDPATAPGADGLDSAARNAPVSDTGDLVDYRGVAAVRRRLLERAADRFFASGGEDDPSFRRWLEAHPRADDYARFRAACDRRRSPWRAWPSRARDGFLAAADVDAAAVRYHRYAAWVADSQLARIAAAGGASLYLDQPIGVHGDGYDVWRERSLFASGVSVGAPPDPFFRDGQNWGFPPVIPSASRSSGHAYFGECLRHHLQHAGSLRLDHVMSLQRLFWIPEGAHARDGVYVEYPQEELLAVLSLESFRHGVVIVGEDLGTVTPGIRAALDQHGILRMYVAQFELRPGRRPPLSPVPPAVAAVVNTHDLPPFAAFWAGLDLDDQHALGMLDAGALGAARLERAALRADLCDAFGIPDPDGTCAGARVFESLLCILAESPAAMLVVNLEDLWGETRPQNVPGTTTQRPNWRRRAQRDLDALLADERATSLLRTIARLRTASVYDA